MLVDVEKNLQFGEEDGKTILHSSNQKLTIS